jgi:predicted short-subunit dehydrogenase-like oxidoreductase (DUF2520 family)
VKPKRKSVARRPRGARWQSRHDDTKPQVVIVGYGRLGAALAFRLKAAGWPVAVLPRSAESVRRAGLSGQRLADHDDLAGAQLCLLAVPDAQVASAALAVVDDLGPKTALLHLAGALDLSVFTSQEALAKRPLGSFHPLVAVSDAKDTLEGHAVALASSERALMPLLYRMALALRLTPLEVPEARRAAYHAGAVLSAGLLVALLDAAVAALEEAGIPREAALGALRPLSESALSGVAQRGLNDGLTGPIARGDLATIERHLAALPAELGALYRQLSRRALALTKSRLPVETVRALERLLA